MHSCPTNARHSPSRILDLLASADFYRDQVAHHAVEEPREARFADTERRIHPKLEASLAAAGIDRLYRHQASAFDLSSSGNNLIVTTGTGSGKSLCYNLPVLNRLLSEPAGAALYLFPTKALAQDQLRGLTDFMPQEMYADAYDGDTPQSRRPRIRKSANIVLTNPDMLHVGILPNHVSWARFFKSLRFVVLDEMHAYSGIFGSHLALIISRLRRICDLYGSRPQFLASSATIRNPVELFSALTGMQGEWIREDESPRGARHVLFWNPPTIEGADGRRSALVETSNVVSRLVSGEVKTIAFAKSRIGVELLYNYVQRNLKTIEPKLASRVEVYRGGYSAKDRRAIEKRLFSGELLCLCTTNAMELGVDIGDLEASVISGYPGGITSFRQQAGRAGRGNLDGIAIYVAQNNPLDQYLIRKPETVMGGKPESVTVHPSNERILSAQLTCAAHDHPIAPFDLETFPKNSLDVIENLEMLGTLSRRAGVWFHPSPRSPAAGVDIRSTDTSYTILLDGEEIGTMEEWRAFENGHEGAVHLHRGEQLKVRRLDFDGRTIEVERVVAEHYTQAVVESAVVPLQVIEQRAFGSGIIERCILQVTTVVPAYRTKCVITDSVVSYTDLELPERLMETCGVMIHLPSAPSHREVDEWPLAIHTFEHAAIAVAPLLASCDPRDIQSSYLTIWPVTMRPCVFVYDSAAGGSGVSDALYECADDLLMHIDSLVSGCRCADGCPACVLIPQCPYSNESISRRALLAALKLVVGDAHRN